MITVSVAGGKLESSLKECVRMCVEIVLLCFVMTPEVAQETLDVFYNL